MAGRARAVAGATARGGGRSSREKLRTGSFGAAEGSAVRNPERSSDRRHKTRLAHRPIPYHPDSFRRTTRLGPSREMRAVP
jgi:hypothetical protein